MALSEKTVLKSVEILTEANAVNVCWSNQILRDDVEVVSEVPHRRSYLQDERDVFVADLEDPQKGGDPGKAAPYLQILGW